MSVVSIWRCGRITEPTIGERLRELRRGIFTRHDLAAAADVSVDVIRKLEQGRQQTASIGTLQRIARVLDVDVGELLGPSRLAPSGEHLAQISAIRDALASADDLLGELDDADAPDLTELGRAVTYAWGLYGAGRYGPLSTMLPRLLTEAQAATHAAASAGADLTGQIHQLAANALVRPGAADLGHVAAREALRLAGVAPDSLRHTTACCTLGHVLIRQGRFVDAERVAEDYVAAAQVARRMPRDSALPLAARSRHLADVAHTQLRLGHTQAAESALLTMERAAPEWTTHHKLPRVLVGELMIRGCPVGTAA